MGVSARESSPDYSLDLGKLVDTMASAMGFGLPGNGPNSKGSTGRPPQNLKEQVAMREAQSKPEAGGPVDVRGGMQDGRWPGSDGWEKRRQNINGVEVHYNYNTRTRATDDWKVK